MVGGYALERDLGSRCFWKPACCGKLACKVVCMDGWFGGWFGEGGQGRFADCSRFYLELLPLKVCFCHETQKKVSCFQH